MNCYIRPLYLTLVGASRLAIPVVVAVVLDPVWMSTMNGMLVTAILLGLYVAYINYQNTVTQSRGLIFEPTSIYHDDFMTMSTSCGFDTHEVRVRYCYAQEGIALAFHDTVGIDPLVWSGTEQDESYKKAHEVLTIHIVPTLTSQQKERIIATQRLLTSAAQRFIFKHELGHIYHRYTYKKIFLNAGIIVVVAYGALSASWALFHAYGLPGVVVIGIGIGIAAVADLTLTFISNVLFKVREEIKADDFAAQYSTPEEIGAAADFFEQHDIQVIQAIREPEWDPLRWLSQEARTGHLTGRIRAQYLRELAENKM